MKFGRKRRVVLVAALVVVMAANVSSCGGSSRSGTTSTPNHPTTAAPSADGSTPTAVPSGSIAQPALSGVPELSVTKVIGGLNQPWDLAFTPDGTMLFTEKTGQVSALVGGVTRRVGEPTGVLDEGEGGLMGLAVDPDFATQRRIYVCAQSTSGGARDVRIMRFRVADDLKSLSDRVDIVTGLPSSSGRHSGCRPRFGPDRMLWIGTGDAAIGTNPQDQRSLGGKVLRVTTDGAAAPGNPGGALDPRIYTWGHRNVQGLAFRPTGPDRNGANQAFSVEHGSSFDDEVNLLRAGANYGWNPGGGSTGYVEGSHPMTDPAIPGAVSAVWSSGDPTIAPSGATFLSGTRWRDWNGALAIAVLKGSQLKVLSLDAAGTAVTGQWSALTDHGRLRSAVQGPDGDLYISTDGRSGTGEIFRVSPH
jgi:glucose/arabinose dehydrogenase